MQRIIIGAYIALILLVSAYASPEAASDVTQPPTRYSNALGDSRKAGVSNESR